MWVVYLTRAQAYRPGDLSSGLWFPPNCVIQSHSLACPGLSHPLTGDQWVMTMAEVPFNSDCLTPCLMACRWVFERGDIFGSKVNERQYLLLLAGEHRLSWEARRCWRRARPISVDGVRWIIKLSAAFLCSKHLADLIKILFFSPLNGWKTSTNYNVTAMY